MRWFQQLRMRLIMLFRRDSEAVRLDVELRYHLDRQTDENLAAGMAPEEARHAALRAFGNPALLRDRTRAAWSWNLLESLGRDAHYAFRALRRTPGFTAIAIMVMALGIGANVTLFTVVRGILLRPLPFQDPQRLLVLYESRLHDGDAPANNPVAGGVYDRWKKENHSFTSLAVVRASRVGLSGSGGQLAEKLNSGEFSWNLLPTLGVQPVLGRNFTESEDSPDAGATALLSWQLWQRRFGGDPSILNRTIYIDARPVTVIGVMPAWFNYPDSSTQLWMPVYQQRRTDDMKSFSLHMLTVVGRLKPGVSQAHAIADLSVISRRIHNENLSDPFIYLGANSQPLLDDLVGDIKRPLYVLLAATLCVLLIACLNVANLLVARSAARRRDLAIRSALGSGWLRLMRERLFESLLLCVFGGALGCALAEGALLWLVRARHDIHRIESIHIDATVVAFIFALIGLCALISGLASAFGAGDRTLLHTLHESSRSLTGERSRTRLRRLLLSLEVGLTVVLLIGAGLLLKSYERLRSSGIGCLTDNVLKLHIGIPDARYAVGAPRINFYDTLLQRARAIPGVTAAGFVDSVPGQGYLREKAFTIVEHPALPQGKGNAALERTADPGYFHAIGIPLLSGRIFNSALRLDAANEIVIDQLLARRFFPGEEPLGKHIDLLGKRDVIVGVVGSTRFAIGEDPRPMLYTSLEAGNESVGEIVIRGNRDAASFALPVQRIVASMDPDLALSDVLTMEQMLGKSTLSASFNATLLSVFAALSLLLAAAGLFGVLSYIAAQRTQEIGIRMALGAQRTQVLQLMLVDGIRPALIGIALGLLAGIEGALALRGLLYKVPALDPAVFIAVPILLLTVAALACALPAWRASRIDAIQALRAE